MTKPLSSALGILIFVIAINVNRHLAATCSSTIAVSYGINSTTICGIVSGQLTQTIQCFKDRRTFSLKPNKISYDSISGSNQDLLCALTSGGSSLLCWNTATIQPKRLHFSYSNRLKDLSVGTSQICAIQAKDNVTLCWRFPSPETTWKFHAITSGGREEEEGFSCGVLTNSSRVLCWGKSETGDEIEMQFGNSTMSSIVAGESHVCGEAKNGSLLCKGSNENGQLNVPSHSPFEFSGLALGARHTCAIQRRNGLVICWGNGFDANKFAKHVSFEVIQAGLDFTCGLATSNFSVICWGPGWPTSVGNVLPLAAVIPGPCVQSSSCSSCGVYPNSYSLCGGGGGGSRSICKSCDSHLPIPALLPPMQQSENVPLPAPTPNKRLLYIIFLIVGSFGILAGICSLIYWLCTTGVLFNTNEPVITNNVASTSNNNGTTLSSKRIDKAEEFSLADLADATGNFSLENKIGGGSFGTVYRGKLGNDDREVAIKRGKIISGEKPRSNKLFQEKETAFDSELNSSSRLHHKHLVDLIGYCHEKDERLLVYEYMKNGSLHDHLHSKSNTEKSSSPLNSWKMRIKIALDAARAIEYLHNYAMPPIIHRDIKSSNILLDGNLTAKVSDFGLSLMGCEDECISTKAVGTVGYIDPEYYVHNVLTVKSDVYGLGVVLLELLTGKRAIFKDEDSNPMSVVEYALPRIAVGKLENVVDERVGPPVGNEGEAVEILAYTAMHCVNLEGKERPPVIHIVANLERALAITEGSVSGTKLYVAS